MDIWITHITLLHEYSSTAFFLGLDLILISYQVDASGLALRGEDFFPFLFRFLFLLIFIHILKLQSRRILFASIDFVFYLLSYWIHSGKSSIAA